MAKQTQHQQQIVAGIAQSITAQIAPEELPLFRSISATYFQNPEQVIKKEQQQDELLGFGGVEAVALLTPYILPVVTEVVKFVADEVQKSLATASANLIEEIIKKLFKRVQPEENDLQPLTAAQLTQVRAVAFEKACQLKLPGNQANLLADAIKGSLLS